MMGLGSGLPLAAGGDPAPCTVLCRHSWPVPLVLWTKERSPALWFHRDSTDSTHLAGWWEQGTSRIPENGVCNIPGAPWWSLGSLCSTTVVTLQEPQCICMVLVGRWWFLAEDPGHPRPCLALLRMRGPAGMWPRIPPWLPGSASPGDRFSLKAAVQGALPPVPKGLTSNFLC